jgi:hypothetical protein
MQSTASKLWSYPTYVSDRDVFVHRCDRDSFNVDRGGWVRVRLTWLSLILCAVLRCALAVNGLA